MLMSYFGVFQVTKVICSPARFENEKVPMKLLLKDLLTAYKYGVKTLYYHNTRDGANDDQDDGCESGACKL